MLDFYYDTLIYIETVVKCYEWVLLIKYYTISFKVFCNAVNCVIPEGGHNNNPIDP